MGGQSWLAYMFAGVMLVTAAYCLARLVISWRQHRRTDRPVDAVHVLMGVAMAGMLVPALRVFWAAAGRSSSAPRPCGSAGWRCVSTAAGRALGRFRPHHVQHVLGCAAMVYMFAAVTTAAEGASGSGMSGMGGAARFPTLALVFALALFGYVVWTADRLPALARVSALAAGLPWSRLPRPCGRACRRSSLAGTAPAAAGRYDGPAPTGTGATWSAGPPLSPRLAACCEIAMGVTMGYALILML